MEHFKLSKNKYHSGFILLLAAASALYLLNINFSQIWIDEAFTKERLSYLPNLIQNNKD